MKFNKEIIINFLLFLIIMNSSKGKLPDGFVYIEDLDKSIKVNLKYFGTDNFVGRRVPHYKANKGIMTKKCADALIEAQKIFVSKGYSIVIYDAYRPESSVLYFVDWMHDANDKISKKTHYPYIDKKKDMEGVYIASRGGHSRGSTVDITLIELNKELLTESVYEERYFDGKLYPFNNDNTIDCGTSYDLMDPASWSNNTINITEEQKNNRKLIKEVMEEVGFENLEEEWWDFTLINQPFPDIYYDFEVE